MPNITGDDEAAILDAFRSCTPDARARLLHHARGLASGASCRTLEDLLRLARSRGLDVGQARCAIAQAVGDPVYRLVADSSERS